MEEKITEYLNGVAEKVGAVITRDTDLFEEGILDSLEIISLLGFLQEEFGISFEPEDLDFENYQTIDKIVEWAESRL